MKIKLLSVRAAITQLRRAGYVIHCETTETAGDPRYRLLAKPGEPIT